VRCLVLFFICQRLQGKRGKLNTLSFFRQKAPARQAGQFNRLALEAHSMQPVWLLSGFVFYLSASARQTGQIKYPFSFSAERACKANGVV